MSVAAFPSHRTVSSQSAPAPWYVARAWQTNLLLAFLGVLLLALSRHLLLEYDDYTIGFSGTSGWSVWCYLLASFAVLTLPTNRWTFSLIVTVAVCCRLATLFGDAFLSSDVYRYVWDGIVQHGGINPYRYVPADPALASLRGASEGNIFPAINRATYARTIYPPFAQIYFWAVTWISPTLTMMKTAMVFCEGVVAWSTVWLLRRLGRPREQAILYLWAPLLIWEIAGSGHLDALAMALIGCAFVARYCERPALTGLFLALAVITKMYPLVLFPALYLRYPLDRRTGRRRATLDWRMPATMVVVIVAGYALYSSAGRLVFGFLGGYVQEEGMASGARYFLLDLVQHIPGCRQLPTGVFLAFAALVFAAICWWSWRTASPAREETAEAQAARKPFARGGAASFLPPAFALAGALMLLFSPHYAWYVAWLIPFLALMPNLPALGYVMGFFYLYTTALAAPGPKMYLANKILYGIVAVCCVLALAARRWGPLTLRFWRELNVRPAAGTTR